MTGTKNYCKVCHRPLKTYGSILKGMGPICEHRAEEQMDFFTQEHAVWEELAIKANIFLIDTGHTERRSITNDAEFVIQDLAQRYIDFDRYRVYYKDSTGKWSELIKRGSKFTGYAPVTWKEPAELELDIF
jgi:hypothetical protein